MPIAEEREDNAVEHWKRKAFNLLKEQAIRRAKAFGAELKASVLGKGERPVSDAWKGELLPLLRAGKLEEARKLRTKHVPKSLFRYRTVNQFTLENLRKRTEWASAPEKCNDPFDTALSNDAGDYLRKVEAERRVGLLKKIESGSVGKLSPEDREELLKSGLSYLELEARILEPFKRDPILIALKALRSAGYFGLQKTLPLISAAASRRARTHTRICCFSETHMSTQMWAYYADNYNGICVEYPMSGEFGAHVWPICYVDDSNFPQLSAAADTTPECFGILVAMHKTSSWKHEREWRHIAFDDSASPGQPIVVPRPKSIYIGHRVDASVVEQVKASAPRVPLYRVVAGNELKLSVTRYDHR